MAVRTNYLISIRADFPVRQRYHVTTYAVVGNFVRKFWVFKMFFQMRTVVKFDRVPVEMRIFFRKFRMPVLEAIKLVFMAGVALLRGQRSRAHGWATMFPMAHDTLRIPNPPIRSHAGIVCLKTRTSETMTIQTLGGNVRISKHRFYPSNRALIMSLMAGGTTRLFCKFSMRFGQRPRIRNTNHASNTRIQR